MALVFCPTIALFVPFSIFSNHLEARNEVHNRIIQDDEGSIPDIAAAIWEEHFQGLAYYSVSE